MTQDKIIDEVERFELLEGFNGWDLHPSSTGDYVAYSDYEKLKSNSEQPTPSQSEPQPTSHALDAGL